MRWTQPSVSFSAQGINKNHETKYRVVQPPFFRSALSLGHIGGYRQK